MITSFEVGAVFKIINEASPQLTKILRQVRELTAAIDKARESLALLAKPASMAVAIGETGELAKAWRDVAKNAGQARLAIGRAASASGRAALSAPAIAMAGSVPPLPGGGRQRLGQRVHGGGTGGVHLSGPGVGLPGGGHVRFHGNAGGLATGGAAMAIYGAYQAAQMEDAVFQLLYHSGEAYTDANRKKFHDILSESVRTSGFSLHDIGEAAKQEIRMFQGTPGGGLDVLPEMLRAATVEARLKGESPEESMKALIGLAHMTKKYDPAAIKKLAPAFAFLSTANPGSLGSIEKAAGYAVPLLQSGLEIDPMQSLLLGTALTRAGATSTKAGTWLREMALRAMPGTSVMSKTAFKRHEEGLRAFGLIDAHDKPTWFTGGKPDIFKMLDIASRHAASIPIDKRAAYERALFGAQGGGGFALLADPAVRQQIATLNEEMNSPAFKNRYGGFVQAYQENSTVQQARTAIGDFNMTMADLGAHTLPAVNAALKDFKGTLDMIRNAIPGANRSDSVVGTRALEGALGGASAGAMIGAFGGPIGMAGGAVIGGVAGVAAGYLEQQARENKDTFEQRDRARGKAALDALKGQPGGPGGIFPGGTSLAPVIHLNLNVDGRSLAQAVSEQQAASSTYQTNTPAANGADIYGP